MVRRMLLWSLLVPASLAAGWGCPGGGFTCQEDAQCTLAGTPGACVLGQCAYPDPECASGLAFPAGAPSDPGECVPGEDIGSTGPGPGPTTSDSSGDGIGTTAQLDSSSGDEDRRETEGLDDGPGSSSDDGPVACEDPYEPNDTLSEASPMPYADRCFSEWTATIEHNDDFDWFLLDDPDAACPSLMMPQVVEADDFVTVCLASQCGDGMSRLVECDGELRRVSSGLLGCCGPGYAAAYVDCAGTAPQWAVQLSSKDGMECMPYRATAHL